MKTFDLTTVYNLDRPLSWSAISSFKWNKQQWYRKYVLKEIPEITPELEFGKAVDLKIQEDPTYLPAIVRYPVMQHEMRTVYDGIPLLGFSDTFRPADSKQELRGFAVTPPAVRDYKTGKKPWTQARADETGQLTMYLGMLYLMDGMRPEDVECYIDWMPTHIVEGKIAFIKEGDVHTFKTKRSMKQVLEFFQLIKDTWAEMEEYATREMSKDMDEEEFFKRS